MRYAIAESQKAKGDANRERVRAWFASHLCGTNRECAEAVGLTEYAVGRHVKAGACRIPLPEGHVGAEPVGRNHVREGLLLPRSYVLFHSIIGALRGSLSRFHLSMRPQFHHHNFATCRSHKHVRPG